MSRLISEIDSARTFVARINDDFPTVVLFHATWCRPCRSYAPAVRRLAAEFNGRLDFVRVDIDKQESISAGADIRLVPTLVVFRAGRPVGRAEGLRDQADVACWLEQFALPLPEASRVVRDQPGVLGRLVRVFAA